jgi:hypothetical protein
MIPQTTPKLHPCTTAILGMLVHLTQYCAAYKATIGSEVSTDYVLGTEVLDTARGLRGLLNGPTGSGDCGKIDAMILSMLTTAGFSDADINN